MKEQIQSIENLFNEKYNNLVTAEDLESLRVEFLGKKGHITNLMPMLRDVPVEQKREAGMMINSLKSMAETKIAEKKEFFENEKIAKQVSSSEVVDITMPVEVGSGSLHPRTIVQAELEDIFKSMGFVVEDGNEVVTEYECFDSVNMPSTHPARDMQDTFWLDNGELLKTHTSALQNAVLKKYGGKTRAIFPGRCYRNEAVDHSHETTFFQMEGMVVDENVSVANLIYFMREMLSKVFGKEVKVRLRPGFFPFVEPGFELDCSCPYCGGKGCRVCKNSGWIELCPCGMIHPNVLKMGGIDPDEYQGFAFGLGLSRLVMMTYGFGDIRHLNGKDLKILEQTRIK